MKAASENDIESMENLLQEGADINEKDSEGSTALHWAVYDGQYEAAKFLLEYCKYGFPSFGKKFLLPTR